MGKIKVDITVIDGCVRDLQTLQNRISDIKVKMNSFVQTENGTTSSSALTGSGKFTESVIQFLGDLKNSYVEPLSDLVAKSEKFASATANNFRYNDRYSSD